MSPKPNWTVGDFTADSVDTERGSVAGVEYVASDQDAQSVVEGASEGTVFFFERGSTYDVSNMTIPRGSTFFGGALAASVETGATGTAENPPIVTFRKDANGDLATISHNTSFYNIEFGGQKGTYTGDGVVEREDDIAFPRFVGCWIHDNADDGWVRRSSARAVLDQCVIEYNDGYGIRAGESATAAYPRHSRFAQSAIRDNGSGGVRYDRTPWNEKFDSRIISNDGPGIEFVTSGNRIMSDMRFEGSISGNTDAGVRLNGTGDMDRPRFEAEINGNGGPGIEATGENLREARIGGGFTNNDGPGVYINGSGIRNPYFTAQFGGNAVSPSVTTTSPTGSALHIETLGSTLFGTISGGPIGGGATSSSLSNQSGSVLIFSVNATGRTAGSVDGDIDLVVLNANWGASFNGRFEWKFVSGGQSLQFNGTTVLGPQSSAYSATNVTTTRSFDADNTTVAELADVVGTIIDDVDQLG